MTIDWKNQYANRATVLAERYPSAAEILTYYAKRVSGHSTDESRPELAESLDQHIRDIAHTHDPKNTAPFPNYCPCCGSPPGAAALRPEADGSRRSLLCSRCAYEWPYQRILCPNCQEQDFDSLPVYIAEDYPHLRVECCATCKHYLIAADLVKDPEAIPLVEDISALTLHLWATDHGYAKIKSNLFGF